MTFSIVARCETTGMLGMAVASSSPAVAARCAHARSGVGAFATQNFTDPTLARRGLDLIERGATAAQAVAIVSATAPEASFRQLAAIGRAGPPAVFTGQSCMALTAEKVGTDAAALGNLLRTCDVPSAMIDAFARSNGHLAARLLGAMKAGLAAGGEVEAVRSAGIVVVHAVAWPVVDLRIDWTDGCPIADLDALWSVWEPRMALYLARALDPAKAPESDEVDDAPVA